MYLWSIPHLLCRLRCIKYHYWINTFYCSLYLRIQFCLFVCIFVLCWLLSHWGRVTHICVNRLTIIGPNNGLSPGRRHAIVWTNAGILLIGPLVTNFSEILIEIHAFLFKKMHLKMSSGKWRPFCLGLNVLIDTTLYHLFTVEAKYPGLISTRLMYSSGMCPWDMPLWYLCY